MLKKNKILLISGAAMIATSGIVAGTVVGLSQSARTNESSLVDGPVYGSTPTTPVLTPSVPMSQSGIVMTRTGITTMSSTGQTFESFQLKLELGEDITKYGTLHFVKNGEKTTEITVVPGEKVQVEMELINPDKHTLLDLWVFDESNENVSLGVTKESDTLYTFTMPKADSEFYVSGSIGIKATFGEKEYNGWVYDFDTKRYTLEVKDKEFVFDDRDEGMQLQSGTKENPIRYRIKLNGNNVKIRHLIIPSGAELVFINTDGVELPYSERPVVYMDKNATLEIKGQMGRFRDVKYSKKVYFISRDWLGLAAQVEEDVLDYPNDYWSTVPAKEE